MQDYVENAKKTITSATRKVIKKSSEVYEVTKLSLKISSLKGEIDEDYQKIGKIVYDNFSGKETPSDEIENLCTKINEKKEEIEEIGIQLSALKNVAICPNCGAEIMKSSTFCAKCGEKI